MAAWFLLKNEAWAQAHEPTLQEDIVVTGERGDGGIEALRHFDRDALRTLGVNNIADLVSRLGARAKGPSGADPVFAINGRRPLDDEEMLSLPFDAVETVDILPPEAGARLGYPPDRPVMNLVTKAEYQGAELQTMGQTTTDGGGGIWETKAAITRLRRKHRITLTGASSLQNELRQSSRRLVADAISPYDAIGNVTGINNSEIDPGLSALAGSSVIIAAVPTEPAARATLNGYLATAGRPRVTDIGRYRSLQPRKRTIKLSGLLNQPISAQTSAAVSVSIERQSSWSLQGVGVSSIVVPAGNASSPFGNDVIVNRYLTEADPLEQRGEEWTLHAAAGLDGLIANWSWMLRLNYDRKQSETESDVGIDASRVAEAVAQGGDAFTAYPAALLANRSIDRAKAMTTTSDAQLILNGNALSMPAGPVVLTASLNAQRAKVESTSTIFNDSNASLTRYQGGGVITATIPIASRSDNVLPFLGQLTLEMSGGVSAISRYDALYTSHLGLRWTPAKRVQLLATLRNADAAPVLDRLASPTITIPNTPFVDLVTGDSLFVTTVTGGNSDLLPEQRSTFTLTANVQPLRSDAFKANLSYESMLIRDQTDVLSTLTPTIAAAMPDRFHRDGSGKLTVVDLRPFNIHRERQQTLRASLSFNGSIGAKSEEASEGEASQVNNAPTNISASLTSSWRLEDRLTLRPGTEVLDLLRGDSITATGGRPHWEFQADFGLYRKGLGFFIQSVWHSGTRSSSHLPAADLSFASLSKTDVTIFADVGLLANNAPWAQKLSIDLTVQNIGNVRQRIRDRLGRTPNGYQPAYIDPLGRVVSLRAFKRF